jgi:flagellar biosynthetic protein FlhB
MAKDGRTEKATPKQRTEQRNKGSIAKSKELGVFFNLASFSIILIYFGEWFVHQIIDLLQFGLELVGGEVEPLEFFHEMTLKGGKIFFCMVLIGILFQFLNHFIQVGRLFSAKILQPDLKKMNPLNYFKNLFSKKSVVEIIKALLIVAILGYVAYAVFSNRISEISGGVLLSWNYSLSMFWDVFKEILLKTLLAFLVISIADFFYQRWEYEEQIKMKKEDVKQEQKDQNGNPEIKRRQRQAMLAMLKRDVKKKIGEGNFVLTNPTHYSIVIRYKRGEGGPKVIVKGVDHMALYIRELAKEHDIPMYEAPPLARELYRRVNEGEYIPTELHETLLEIMMLLVKTGQLDLNKMR